MPEVSIVIPAFRAEDTIERCLRALAAQQGAPVFEVVLVDSSPGDQAIRSARSVAGEVGLSLRAFHLAERTWPGVARNEGARHASAGRLLFLDADVEAAPDLLACALRAWREGTEVVGGEIALADESTVSARLRHLFEFKESMPGNVREVRWQLPSACLGVTRAAFERAGGFPPTRASEDWLFNWSLWQKATRMAFEPALRVRHHTKAGWADFFRYAGVLGHASGAARREGSLPGQLFVQRPWLAFLLPFGRTWRAAAWALRVSPEAAKLLLWTWPAYLAVCIAWAAEFRRGVLDLPAPSVGR